MRWPCRGRPRCDPCRVRGRGANDWPRSSTASAMIALPTWFMSMRGSARRRISSSNRSSRCAELPPAGAEVDRLSLPGMRDEVDVARVGDRDELEPERPGIRPGQSQVPGARYRRNSGGQWVPGPPGDPGMYRRLAGPADPVDRRPERQRPGLADRDATTQDGLGGVGMPGQPARRRGAESLDDLIERAVRDVQTDRRGVLQLGPADPARRPPPRGPARAPGSWR